MGTLDKKVIILTFDDGPVEATGPILDILRDIGIKATFFIIGEEGQKRPGLLRRISDEGHVIGNHTWSHPSWLGFRSRKFINEQIDWTNDLLKTHIGKHAVYMRTPFGESTAYSDWIIKQKHMITIPWTFKVKDWPLSFTKEDLHRKFSQITDSEVVFLHDRAYARPEMIQSLREELLDLQKRGFEFITLDQLYF